jgi:hypothetical protein
VKLYSIFFIMSRVFFTFLKKIEFFIKNLVLN